MSFGDPLYHKELGAMELARIHITTEVFERLVCELRSGSVAIGAFADLIDQIANAGWENGESIFGTDALRDLCGHGQSG